MHPRATHQACASAGTGASGAPRGWDIRTIASDVDGTLVNSKQQLTERVAAAARAAHDVGVPLLVATGKARGPWASQVLPRLGPPMPGVYMQGLLIFDDRGRVMRSRCLDEEVLLQGIRMAKEYGVTLTAYADDEILCEATDAETDRLLFYNEPPPRGVGDMEALVGKRGVQKIIFMAPQPRIDALRPAVAAAMEGRGSLTTAVSGMLEVLPLGASKGEGVSWLLAELGRDPAHLMALGDGENDLEMLQLAALGVAMGNAGPALKAAADMVVGSNDEDGVAQAIEAHVLAPRRARSAA